jgi:hypothetical protein
MIEYAPMQKYVFFSLMGKKMKMNTACTMHISIEHGFDILMLRI